MCEKSENGIQIGCSERLMSRLLLVGCIHVKSRLITPRQMTVIQQAPWTGSTLEKRAGECHTNIPSVKGGRCISYLFCYTSKKSLWRRFHSGVWLHLKFVTFSGFLLFVCSVVAFLPHVRFICSSQTLEWSNIFFSGSLLLLKQAIQALLLNISLPH